MEGNAEQVRAKAKPDSTVESNRLAKLICKLRWIGMEEEARQLQLAQRLSMERGGVIFIEPFNTD